ncbi:unnamed protein product [Leuciscus chuanchicus]
MFGGNALQEGCDFTVPHQCPGSVIPKTVWEGKDKRTAVTQNDGQLRLEMHRSCCHPPSPSPSLTMEDPFELRCLSERRNTPGVPAISCCEIDEIWLG